MNKTEQIADAAPRFNRAVSTILAEKPKPTPTPNVFRVKPTVGREDVPVKTDDYRPPNLNWFK